MSSESNTPPVDRLPDRLPPRLRPRGLPGTLARAWRRLIRSLLPPPVDLVYSPRYRVDLGGTPYDARRGERILSFLFAHGLLARRRLHAARRASMRALLRVHDAGYLERLHQPGALDSIVGFEVDERLAERAIEAQRYAVGGTIWAVRRALDRRRVVFNLGGGFHHAGPSRGAGLCIFNDLAVAVAVVRAEGFDGRVLVVDLDLHDGNGTRQAFADDPTVFTLSIHNRSWDLEPAVAARSIELEGAVEDGEYLEVVRREVPAEVERFAPELVIYVAGADPAADDRLGNWEISESALFERDRLVTRAARERPAPIPLAVTLAGGYGGNAWRYPARYLGWLLSGRDDLVPPTTEALTLADLRRLTRLLEPAQLAAEPRAEDDDPWGLTEEDVYGQLGAVVRKSRFLGTFSKHGIELVLERSGFIDRLRERGFAHPTVELELDHPAGETLRVIDRGATPELLVEVRLTRDRTALPDHELMRIEWLLLQNPRKAFPGRRSPLPGQRHPGLGLLTEAMALLVLLAERAGLDGIVFVPSHYHLASKGSRYLRFADPDDAAWVAAVERAVEPLPLAEATRAVEAGRVVDAETGGPISWRPMVMVLPITEELVEALDRRDPAASDFAFRLADAG